MSRKELTVYQIDFKYRSYLRKICMNALSFNRGIPLTWEDIYNNFLYEAIKILKDYDEDSDITIKTFLGIKCKFFAMNYCKSFKTNKHRVMNDSIPIKPDWNIAMSDSTKPLSVIDISLFSSEELMVYKLHYLEGQTFKQIALDSGFTYYKIRAIDDLLRAKMFSNLKN